MPNILGYSSFEDLVGGTGGVPKFEGAPLSDSDIRRLYELNKESGFTDEEFAANQGITIERLREVLGK